jgi:exopolysaccharide biosynthesis polyprenyl glycosylphosphotransferase
MTWVALMDLLSLVGGAGLAVVLRFHDKDIITGYVLRNMEGWLLFSCGILLANYLSGSYSLQHMYSRFNLVVTWAFSVLFTLLILSITSYAWLSAALGRGVLLLALAFYSVLSVGLKMIVYRGVFRGAAFLCRTAVVGTGRRAREIRASVEGDLVMPAHKVVSFIRLLPAEEGDERLPLMDGVVTVESRREDLESVLLSLGVKLVVVGLDDVAEGAKLYPRLSRLRFHGVEVLSPLNVTELYSGRTPLELVTEETMMHLSLECEFPMLTRVKRLLDLFFSLIGALVFLPVALLAAAMVKITDLRAPVFYSQVRIGQFGKTFRICKFRTMRPDAEAASGPVWASARDPRVTPVGRFLRATRMDELPQFWNVLRGDMSLVGPRPERPELAAMLREKIPFYSERENVLPGLTGWAQVRYPYGSSAEDTRRKLEYDLYYIKHVSLALDLQILLSTLRIVLFGKERQT